MLLTTLLGVFATGLKVTAAVGLGVVATAVDGGKGK